MIHLVHPLPRLLLRTAMGCALLVVLVLLALLLDVMPGAQEQAIGLLMLPFLAGFAFFKGALARDTQLTLREGGPGAAVLIAQHGSAGGVRQWIAYKYAATVMAVIACLVIAALVVRPG